MMRLLVWDSPRILSAMTAAHNVLGTPLLDCSHDPLTGFYRDGCCNTGPGDHGRHMICAKMTADFLAYSKSVGNDLSTPMPQYEFPGLKPGNQWCLCALRWQQAYEAGCAPEVVLESTHMAALEFVSLGDLEKHRAS